MAISWYNFGPHSHQNLWIIPFYIVRSSNFFLIVDDTGRLPRPFGPRNDSMILVRETIIYMTKSFTTSPAKISPAAPGTQAVLPGIVRLPMAAASSSAPTGVRASSVE